MVGVASNGYRFLVSRYVCMGRALWGVALSSCIWIWDRLWVRAVEWMRGCARKTMFTVFFNSRYNAWQTTRALVLHIIRPPFRWKFWITSSQQHGLGDDLESIMSMQRIMKMHSSQSSAPHANVSVWCNARHTYPTWHLATFDFFTQKEICLCWETFFNNTWPF